MTDQSISPRIKASLLAAANLAMALFIGAWLGGRAGTVTAGGLFLLLLAVPHATGWIRAALKRRREGERIWQIEAARVLGKLVLAPFALILALASSVGAIMLGSLISVWPRFDGLRAGRAGTAAPSQAKERRTLAETFTDGSNLALTLGNLIMLLVIGSVWIGVEVAYYAALLATPIWLLVLIMLAIEGAEPLPGPETADHAGP